MGRLKITQEDDSVRKVAYLDEVQDVADDVDDLLEDVDELQGDLESVKTDYLAHTKNIMPHEFRDLKNDKTYKYGFQISGEGNPQLIFEEVKNV